MFKNLSKLKIFSRIITIVTLLWISCGHLAHAQTVTGVLSMITNPLNFTIMILSFLARTALEISSWFVALTGVLLNVAMYLTTHIDIFIKQTPVVYTVWALIRDLCSMVLIFFILYAAIQMIIGKSPGFGQLIKSIIIMGILINFSFFLTRVLIDASNIVSLEFYNAMAPQTRNYDAKNMSVSQLVDKLISDGGLSDVFMGALKLSSWHSDVGKILTDPSANEKIVLVSFGGVIVQITAGLSFLAAAMAAVIRMAVLIFLLAFSPVWIAAMALPKLQGYLNDWYKHFSTQLIFLPVYLMLMYVAIRILTASNLNSSLSNFMNISAPGQAANISVYINLFVGFVIVITMINIPLITAIKISGLKIGAVDSLNKWAGGFWKKATVGFAGATVGAAATGAKFANRELVSRGASRLAKSESLQKLAGSSLLGEMALKGVRIAGKEYDTKLNKQISAREEFAKTFTKKDDAIAYANRTAGSIPAKMSMFGVIGRADRVAAAKILNDRLREVQEENDKWTNSYNQLDKKFRVLGIDINGPTADADVNAALGLNMLTISEVDKYDLVKGRNVGGKNTKLKNELQSAQSDLGNRSTGGTPGSGILGQIEQFENTTGASLRDISKRGY